MKILLGTLVALNILDAFLTEQLIKSGVARELNPVLMSLIGKPAFLGLKIAGVALCGVIIWDIHRRHPRLAFMSTSCFVAVYSGIVLWNFYLLIG